ncbi:MAG TPA: Asp-tRNA(Asn)/Glu-tRNA(Gln) amidotransferase subunit GatC [Candidatus Hydrogenedens sp.]|nr:Asp-tRNA(Asn)/Glu-tRNA(Gln) amidotransferase subunit GatC [Candidatus Hydrogenedens sp.]HOK08500.1 Asp-tRNA(Asn)/Glu-tRNA(Gln) amidotransferase subunit GatC [Candidatus Hydrogenedens sp.]HOL20336.1 Asp-tRNA(Asn)/Glu-tRNA(Gln) amidotransferase subunit GatC [Candidatus Hydrogenedens sp.]HPP57830.1 Asp-tRNA(Asn)/Glu-tRNA(Gln) amidotransferase subunit GatC [Candidatus Hydrogenedens sp.]
MEKKKITREEIHHIADLAYLFLDDEKAEKLALDLSEIIGYVEKLNELSTDDVEPMMHAVPLENILREDDVKPSIEREDTFRCAPLHDGEYFLVPKILEVD